VSVKIHEIVIHNDERGFLAELLRRDLISEEIKQIYFSVSKKGSIRGDHFHKKKTEWFCVLSGKAKLVLKSQINDRDYQEIILSGEDLKMVEIPPFIFHRIESLTDDMLLLVCASELYKSEDHDTYKLCNT
jgi:dTDP-4-dehydrorhamnose 3,5-epimerase-like enzyme